MLLCACSSASPRPAPVVGPPAGKRPLEVKPAVKGPPSVEVTLADWGLASVEEIQWAHFGITDGALSLYDLRAKVPPPTPPEPPTPIDLRGGRFIIGRYLRTTTNRLGGRSGAFSGQGGSASAEGSESGIKLRYASGRGYAGMWLHLRATDDAPTYLDLGTAKYFEFAVKGTRGGENLELRVADEALDKKEDSVAIGKLSRFLPRKKVDTSWQVAAVPISAFPKTIDLDRLSAIALLAKGAGEVTLRDVAFSIRPAPQALPLAAEPIRRGLWVWDSAGLFEPKAAAELATFCQDNGVSDVFVQLPRFDESLAKLRPAVDELHAAGLRVEALDGAPNYALPDNHKLAARLVSVVADYNRAAGPRERFDGVHLDVEPYLLPGFGGVGREKILRGFLAMLDSVRKDARRAGLPLTVDIPVWYDSRDRFGNWTTAVDDRPLSELVTERADAIALMDYRTRARGLVLSARTELTYAESQGKPVFVGLETAPLPDELLVDSARGGTRGGALALEAMPNGRVRLTWHAEGTTTGLVLGETSRTRVPGSDLSFATGSPADLRAIMENAQTELADWMTFAGFAIHDRASLRTLLSSKPL